MKHKLFAKTMALRSNRHQQFLIYQFNLMYSLSFSVCIKNIKVRFLNSICTYKEFTIIFHAQGLGMSHLLRPVLLDYLTKYVFLTFDL